MYFNSVEFTDFPPFAKGSRMECRPVPDKPDDLAEVHLITGENGTGKSRLLCGLAAVLGGGVPLRKRCGKRFVNFGVAGRIGFDGKSTPLIQFSSSPKGIEPTDELSTAFLKLAGAIPAISGNGISFINSALVNLYQFSCRLPNPFQC